MIKFYDHKNHLSVVDLNVFVLSIFLSGGTDFFVDSEDRTYAEISISFDQSSTGASNEGKYVSGRIFYNKSY